MNPFDIAPSARFGDVFTPEFTESIVQGRARYRVMCGQQTYLDDLSAKEALRFCDFLNGTCEMLEGEAV